MFRKNSDIGQEEILESKRKENVYPKSPEAKQERNSSDNMVTNKRGNEDRSKKGGGGHDTTRMIPRRGIHA